ncbi:MAG: CHASE domain-containing protein [Verrucomicrobiota bacterium]
MQIHSGKRSIPGFVGFLSVALLYFIAAWGGLELASLHDNVSPVWPATGVAIAALIISRNRWWPAILAGAFAANALLTGVPVWTALGIGVGNTLEALLGAALFLQVLERAPLLGKFAEGAGFLVASFSAPVVSAGIGVGTLYFSGLVPGEAVSELLLTWWTGDALGALVVTPALLAVWRPGSFDRRGLPQLCVFTLLTSLVCGWILAAGFEGIQIFLVFPLLLVATWWFGGRGVKFTTLFLVGFTVVVMVAGDRHLMAPTLNQSLLLLELYLFALACTGLLLAAFHQTGLLLLPGLVMVAGWLVSGVLFASLEQERRRLDTFRFDTLVHDSEELLLGRMQTYIDALRGCVSFLTASETVTRGEWHTYVNSLEINRRHPGINGVGMVLPLRSYEVDDFLASTRLDGLPDFEIHTVPDAPLPPDDPAGSRHYPITYIEPLDLNLKAVGLDLNSEPNRAAAARKSRDTGRPTITDRIVLVQDGRQRPGFLLFYPFYQPGRSLDTVDERRAAFRGWVYAPFITEVFLNAVLEARTRQVSMHIYEGLSPDPAALVYHSGHEDRDEPEDHFDRLTTIRLADKDYTIGWHHGPDFQPGEMVPAMIAGSSLAMVSALLAGLVLTLQTLGRRAGEIAESRTRELRDLNAKLGEQVAERTRAESEARLAREAAEAANSAKSDFLATMSHEIRTPMNSVIGYTDLLLDSAVNDEQRIWLGNIQTSGRALLALINDILDFSKIEAGKLDLENIPFCPLAVAREVAGALAPKAGESRLQLLVDVQSELPESVMGDPGRYRQVLTNLVANAIKFTESGSVRIGLDWQVESGDRGRLSAVVQDTGIGIPADKLKGLFTKFTQADSSTTRRYGGTGLGLAICKELVGLMGGEIAAHSVPGKGTRIGFEIPFVVAGPSADARPQAAAESVSIRTMPDTRVLLAEDALMNQRLAVAVLQRLGCLVDLAVNGREAVDKFKDCRYDIVYMDCQMPEMDGFAATRRIREIERGRGERRPVPIVAVTANALQGDREKCLEAGMNDYMTKPFTIADIARTLDAWVGRDRA